jgi:hypothetical protein
MIFQILIFVGAKELKSACASVFIATNSTHSKPVSIILLTAFCHAHHTQTTTIFAIGDIESFILTSVGHTEESLLFHESKSFNLSSLFVII